MIGKLLVILMIAIGSLAAYRQNALTFTGAVMAFAVGTAVYVGFGSEGFILLVTFFLSSTIWSKFKRSKKAHLEEKLEKGSRRDWRQVLANGGTAAAIAIFHYFMNQPLWTAAFAVAIASANSDTWASEIGSLSKQNPVDIRTMKRVDKGISGAVSLLGSFAALLGSLLIALLSYLLFHLNLTFTFLIFAFGFFGNVIDTIFGAFYQQRFTCQYCGIETEKKIHCGQSAIRIKGYRFIDNDMVNFLSGFLAVLLAIGVIFIIK